MVQVDWDKVKSRSRCVCCAILPSGIRLLITTGIIALVAVTSVIVYNSPPFQYTAVNVVLNWSFDPRPMATYDSNFTYNVLLDPHCHTTYSDGSLSPEQNIQWHIDNGYNAMIVTDHNNIQGSIVAQQIAIAKYNDKIKVITGMEWTNCRVHLNFIGINESVTPIKNPTDLEIQQAINRTHELGGLVIMNHRPWDYWSNMDTPSIQDFAAWGVDFFDVANGHYFDFQTLVYARSQNIRVVTANDYHSGGLGATGWTVLNIPGVNYNPNASISADYFTTDQLWNAIKSQPTSFIYDVVGHGDDPYSYGGTNPKWLRLYPWIQMGAFFHSFYYMNRGMYSFVNGENCGPQSVVVQKDPIISTVLWVLGLFVIGELIRCLVTFVINKIKQRYDDKNDRRGGRYLKEWESEFGVVDTPLLNQNL
ncbi:hypothetical protein SAMD00019534_067930 [Acytostelium subglobosum LB1]|uniref:hypothetical protein n=1 Tax=Acytostelium subglobosum LB1 TaxID=1410327 RepID=UPI000644CFF3|nr:hypothetical protein SAMD00019534_067930 [Acytostelium subglobosum LB1]GAM23618.1 hypothetical protein SAMD00019534_067930 [Acytostelium subglobosum LB1]|eukprot:XP_012753359.1 hypothetical protein SAMD00019534_067930 [Acytostelium subglobosum LB1]